MSIVSAISECADPAVTGGCRDSECQGIEKETEQILGQQFPKCMLKKLGRNSPEVTVVNAVKA